MYPRTNDELESYWDYPDSAMASSFRVTANSTNVTGGYSYFVLEGVSDENQLKDYNQIAVSYAEPPTWQEVQWTRVAKRFDEGNISEKGHRPAWAVDSSPGLDWIGGTCGNVQVYLARGLTYQQVLDESQAEYDEFDMGVKVMDFN